MRYTLTYSLRYVAHISIYATYDDGIYSAQCPFRGAKTTRRILLFAQIRC